MEPGGVSARSDLIGGAGWILFGLVVLAGALSMERYEQMGATLYTMPGFVPGIIGIVLMLLGALLSLRAWRDARSAPGNPSPPRLLTGRVLLMLALTLGYAVGLVGRVPFWLATGLFVTVFTWLYTPPDRTPLRRSIAALLSGVLTTVAVVLVFERVFLVRLP
jgi:hypothetical protein